MSWLQSVPIFSGLVGAILGAVLTGIVWILVQRRYGSALANASNNLVKITEQQVTALERTLQVQKDHYEAQALETKSKYEKDLLESKARGDDYEKRLHDRRNEWMAKELAMTEELAQLRERPDLGTLKSLVEAGISQSAGIASTIGAIGETLRGHVSNDAETFKKIERSMQRNLELQEKIFSAITDHHAAIHGERRKRNKPHA